MKHSLLLFLTYMSVLISGQSSCKKNEEINNTKKSKLMANEKIQITVNSQVFTATLSDNNSSKAFKGMLPLTIDMIELNGNEKYHDFDHSLPNNSFNPKTINNGDIMLYGSKTLVLFYKSFSTSYSYTKLGTIEDVTGLAAALGSENVRLTIELVSQK